MTDGFVWQANKLQKNNTERDRNFLIFPLYIQNNQIQAYQINDAFPNLIEKL